MVSTFDSVHAHQNERAGRGMIMGMKEGMREGMKG